MASFAFRVHADCVAPPPSAAVEPRGGRYEIRALSVEVAAGAARQLFQAQLGRQGVTPCPESP